MAINFVCCSVVVDNCDYTPQELSALLWEYIPRDVVKEIKVTESYYPKQRVITGPSVEHIKQILFVLHRINDRDKDAA